MDKDFTISVIIPTLNNQDLVEKIILKLNKQTLLPKEIVICDSSSGKEVEEITKKINSDIPISYVAAGRAFPFDRFMIKRNCSNAFKILKFVAYTKKYVRKTTHVMLF